LAYACLLKSPKPLKNKPPPEKTGRGNFQRSCRLSLQPTLNKPFIDRIQP
jgi:hypothetical protein